MPFFVFSFCYNKADPFSFLRFFLSGIRGLCFLLFYGGEEYMEATYGRGLFVLFYGLRGLKGLKYFVSIASKTNNFNSKFLIPPLTPFLRRILTQ